MSPVDREIGDIKEEEKDIDADLEEFISTEGHYIY